MQAKLLLFASLVSIVVHACNQPTGQQDASLKSKEDSSTNAYAAMSDTVTVVSKEEAETIVAMHYSKLNREAKYQLYQGLLVRIDSISGDFPDTLQVHSTIHGRKWLTPNGDTVTIPFRETKALKTWRKDRQWISE